MTVCLIDRDRDVCNMLRLFFEARNHRCLIAHDGKSGLALVKEFRPDAVFLDIRLPEMNGYEVIREIRADKEIAKTPAIVLTSITRQTDQSPNQWARACDADALLHKPFELDELIRAVESATEIPV